MRLYAVITGVILLATTSLGSMAKAESPMGLVGKPPEKIDSAEEQLAKLSFYPLRLPDNAFPDWRSLTLAEIERYEDFIKKNRGSPLVPIAQLMIMRLYLEVIKPEVYLLRKREFDCWKLGTTIAVAQKCSVAAQKELARLGSWLDPLYVKRGEELAERLLLQHGHKRPFYRLGLESLEEKNNEELGAWVLYWMADGSGRGKKYKLYKKILEERYQISATIELEIKEFVETFEKKK